MLNRSVDLFFVEPVFLLKKTKNPTRLTGLFLLVGNQAGLRWRFVGMSYGVFFFVFSLLLFDSLIQVVLQHSWSLPVWSVS